MFRNDAGSAHVDEDGVIIPYSSKLPTNVPYSSRKRNGILWAVSVRGREAPVSITCCINSVLPIAWSAHVGSLQGHPESGSDLHRHCKWVYV